MADAPSRSLTSLFTDPGNLPASTTSFIGRDNELADLATSLRDARYVTLTGTGGVGKTRLALEAAARVLAEYDDGAWWCELAAVKEPTAVPAAVASTLGVQQRQAQRIEESLLEFLQTKEMLLVLDNCEHLLDGIAPLMHAIATRCSRVTLLTTSREPTGLPGEHVLAVTPLDLPHRGMSRDDLSRTNAVRLFAERAGAAHPGFAVSAENAEAVAEVCRCVDGIPLAIEIAATRVKAMTPGEIATGLHQRLGLLGAGTRTPIERHQTLRRTIDWSYELLPESERRLFEGLGVFLGSFNLDAALSIATSDVTEVLAVLELLTGLVQRSLVVADEQGGRTRYRLLETVRQYAEERLEARGDIAEIRRHHARYYLRMLVAATPHLRGPDQVRWSPRVERELHNLRSALAWAVETGDVDVALRLVPTLPPGTVVGDTVLSWADTAITTRGSSDHPLFPKVAALAAIMAAMHGDLDRATEISRRALEANDRLVGRPEPLVFYSRALAAVFTGDFDDAVEWSDRAVDGARRNGDSVELVFCLAAQGWSHGFGGDPQAGIAHQEEAVAVARRLGNPTTLAWALRWLGDWLVDVDHQRALRVLDEAVKVGTVAGHQYAVAQSRVVAASIRARTTDPAVALRALLDALEYQHDIGYVTLFIPTAVTLASALCRAGDYEGAGVLRGAVEGFGAQTSLSPHVVELQSSTAVKLRAVLSDDLLTELEALGTDMDERQTLAYARGHVESILAVPVAEP